MTEVLKIKNGLYLSLGVKGRGGILAVISDGSPQRGDAEVTVLDVKYVRNSDEGKAWFQEVQDSCLRSSKPN